MILKATYFTDYADNKNPFVGRDSTTDVIKALQETEKSLVNWFLNADMKLHTDK